jgi:death-on-curing protein
LPNEPIWLPRQAVIDINREVVEATGENHALLFPDKLESALARPINAYFYEETYDVVSLTVNLMVAIGQAHAFEQGNKRTAFISGLAFLGDNGYAFVHPDTTPFAMDIEAVITREMSPGEFEEYFAHWVVPLPEDED